MSVTRMPPLRNAKVASGEVDLKIVVKACAESRWIPWAAWQAYLHPGRPGKSSDHINDGFKARSTLKTRKIRFSDLSIHLSSSTHGVIPIGAWLLFKGGIMFFVKVRHWRTI